MMKRVMTGAAVVALSLVAAAPARAQAHLGISAGASVPTGAFGDGVDAGYNVNGLFDISMPMSPIGFRGEVGWNKFDRSGTTGSDVRVFSGSGNVVLMPVAIFMVARPYLIGGIGAYNLKFTGPAVLLPGGAGSDTRVGFNGGVGFKTTLGGIGALVEARYVSISGVRGGPSTTYVPISFGLTF